MLSDNVSGLLSSHDGLVGGLNNVLLEGMDESD